MERDCVGMVLDFFQEGVRKGAAHTRLRNCSGVLGGVSIGGVWG
jgi:hypothetical protein